MRLRLLEVWICDEPWQRVSKVEVIYVSSLFKVRGFVELFTEKNLLLNFCFFTCAVETRFGPNRVAADVEEMEDLIFW